VPTAVRMVNIGFFIIGLVIVVALSYNNNPFSSFNIIGNTPYHQTALAIPNVQTNNTIKPTNQPQASNDTVTTPGITLDTDKSVYVAGEWVTVNGKVDKVIEEGKVVRLDFYDPDGNPIQVFSPRVELDKKGFFSYSGTAVYIPSNAKPGEYTFLATYNKQSVETKIMVK
jgi:hypothetical protein